jgi:hypothetical protein
VLKKDIEIGEPLDDFILVFAKWSEDQVWYRAQVIEVISDHEFKVLFVDYGNEAIVETVNVVMTPEQIPNDALVDENVFQIQTPTTDENTPDAKQVSSVNAIPKDNIKETSVSAVERNSNPIYAVNDVVVAQWQEDAVWYNAKILEVNDNSYKVQFSDYGNEDTVLEDQIVAAFSNLPKDAALDENVISSETVNPVTKDAPKETTETIVVRKAPIYSVNDVVIAQWQEDAVWYNAKVLEVNDNSSKVQFSDYGNEDTVLEDQIVTTFSDLPEDAVIDEHVESTTQDLDNNNTLNQLDTDNNMEKADLKERYS